MRVLCACAQEWCSWTLRYIDSPVLEELVIFIVVVQVCTPTSDQFVSIWVLLYVSIQFDQHHFLKMLLPFFFSMFIFGILVEEKLTSVGMWIYVWVSS